METPHETFHPLIDYNSPSVLKRYLDEHGLGMQKKFGQNFLINGDARRRLVEALEVPHGELVWEVGPGLGAMTAELIIQGARVKAFEIDRGFAQALRDLIPDSTLFTLVEGNVLKTWPQEAHKERDAGLSAAYFLGNLPYNIAAILLADFIEKGRLFKRMVVTVQKEVAQRMFAKPGTKDYSSFSVLCSSAYSIKPIMVLKGASFYPVPRVDSQAVRMDLRQDRNPETDSPIFRALVRSLFANRRKNLKNNLLAFLSGRYTGVSLDVAEVAEAAIAKAGLKSQQRAEEIELESFIALSREVESFLCQ